MTALDNDISRIAALRGRTPEQAARAIAAAHAPRYPHRHEVDRIFAMSGATDDDFRAYEALPPKSRAFIRESPRPLNAVAWADLLVLTQNEDEIIKAVTFCLPPTRRPTT